MKSILKSAALFFLLWAFQTTSSAQDIPDLIDNINEEIESIHMDTLLKTVTLQNQEFLDHMTDGGGELTGFYKGNRIHRIYRSIGISNGVYITEFYYRKKQLICVSEQFNSYVYDDSLQAFDYTKINTTFSGKYYFNNQKLIFSKSTGYGRFERDLLDPAKALREESEEDLRLLHAKMDKINLQPPPNNNTK